MSEDTNDMPLLTFNSLYNILREEKRTKKLQKLPDLVYEALEKFLEDKKEEIKKLKEEGGNNEKLKKERYILHNSKKISYELLNLRFVKISNIAIKNKIFEDEILNEENILNKEKKFFNGVQSEVGEVVENL